MKVEKEESEGSIDQPTVTCREGKVPMMMQESWQQMPNTSLPQDLRVWTRTKRRSSLELETSLVTIDEFSQINSPSWGHLL
jgi:hypothetical protein